MSTRAALLLLRFAVSFGVVALAGCRDAPKHRKLPAFVGSTPAVMLDSLAGELPVEVSVSGYVVEPPDGHVLLLDDGTGLARVALPDTLPLPLALPVQTRVLVQGLLRREDGHPLVKAEEWHYDSLAVPVRSP